MGEYNTNVIKYKYHQVYSLHLNTLDMDLAANRQTRSVAWLLDLQSYMMGMHIYCSAFQRLSQYNFVRLQ